MPLPSSTHKLIGNEWNKWRQREVFIYQDPDNEDMVYTIGVPFSEKFETVNTHEAKEGFKRSIAIFPKRLTVH